MYVDEEREVVKDAGREEEERGRAGEEEEGGEMRSCACRLLLDPAHSS